MEYVVPVVWINYDMVFPAMYRTKGTRLNELAELLAQAAPDPVDAMSALLHFSKKHMTLSQRVGKTGHPLHVFIMGEAGWRSMLNWLRGILSVKGNYYNSAGFLASQAPKVVESPKVVQIPPGTSKEEADRILAAAQAMTPPPPPAPAPAPVSTPDAAKDTSAQL